MLESRNTARGSLGGARYEKWITKHMGVMQTHRPEMIANAFLSKHGAVGRLTQMQVQKLVYIAHGWMLGLSGHPLVDCEPEAWDRGPVFPDLRDHIKNSGSRPITSLIHEHDDNPFAVFGNSSRGDVISGHLDDYQIKIIDHVWSRYGDMGAFRLSDLTHLPNTPWSDTYENGLGRNDPIPNNVIRKHYWALATNAA